VPTGVQNTTAWSIAAAFEHLWTPALRTSIYGSYIKVTHNTTAVDIICANGGIYGTAGTGSGCNPNWSGYVIGSRTQWEPVRGWIMGVDVLYTHLSTAKSAVGATITPGGAATAYTCTATTCNADQSAWVFTFRTQRDYHP
jgi:hypothetical protein